MGNRQAMKRPPLDEYDELEETQDDRIGFYNFGKKLTVREGERFEVWKQNGKYMPAIKSVA